MLEQRRALGFSMIELLFVVVILGVLASLAAPSLRALILNNRLTGVANDMLAGVMLARSEAIKRGRQVVLCKSNNGADCNNSISWAAGWLVFVDANNNGSRDGADEVLRFREGGIQVSATVTGSIVNYISFGERGGAMDTAGATQSGAITFCTSGLASRVLTLIGTGRASVSTGVVCP